MTGSTCTVTVGQSGSLICDAGATCHFVCTSSCSVSAPGTADLRCAGDTASHPVSGSATCA
jgi:hypothetical protein